jgi:similar to stage IV sporulation protein
LQKKPFLSSGVAHFLEGGCYLAVIRLIRYFFGFVLFKIEGKYIERFLNLAASNAINLWDVKSYKDTFLAKTFAGEYKNLRFFAKKSKVRLKIIHKYGMPFFVNQYKNRLGLVVGPFCFAIIIYVLSLFIWNVDVKVFDAVNIDDAQVLKIMKDIGLYSGSLKNNVDAKILANSAMEKLKDVAWLSININGCNANIEVQERVAPPELVSKDKPCNIKAARGGQIIRMEIYEGTAEVKNGSAVDEGDLLVNGFVENSLGINTLKHARAKIFAKTKHVLHQKMPLEQQETVFMPKTIKRKSINFFGMNMPLNLTFTPSKQNYERELKIHKAKLNERTMPITFYEEIWTQKYVKNITLSLDQAREKIRNMLVERTKKEFNRKKILSYNEKESFQNGILHTDAIYICEEDIAQQEEIMLK